MTRPTLAIVGASLAGAKAAEAARGAGHEGRIVPVGEDARARGSRPRLADRNVASTDMMTPLGHRA